MSNWKAALAVLMLPLSVLAADSSLNAAWRVGDIRQITLGQGPAYSAARQQLAFVRYDATVIGEPDLHGRNDNTGTFQLCLSDPDGVNERCISCNTVPGGPQTSQT